MSTESTGRNATIRRGRGHVLANKTASYGGGIVLESLEELCSMSPLPNLILQLNDLKTQFNAHCADGTTAHTVADATNPVTAADATTLTTAYTLANALKVGYEAHRQLTAGSVHDAADSTNTISAANATTVATLVTLTEEMVVDYEAHRVNVSTCHDGADSTNAVTESNYSVYTCTTAIFPAGSIGLGCCTYVKKGMGTAVNFDVGVVGTATLFASNELDTDGKADLNLSIDENDSAVAVILTPDTTPTTVDGLIYVQIHFLRLRALTDSPTT